MKLNLIRVAQSEAGTFGVLVDEDNEWPICLTCEEPWLDNTPSKSCIPVGDYAVAFFTSQKHPNVWQVLNVPGRSGILIHDGNEIQDTAGCILVGSYYDTMYGLPAVMNSEATLAHLRATLPKSFGLTIKNGWN